MECNHEETVYDTGRTFCSLCGIQCEQPAAQVEDPLSSRDLDTETSRGKYFQRALACVLGEEAVSEAEHETLTRIAGQAALELCEVPSKLSLKRFLSRQDRRDSAVCRRHFPLFMSKNGHPLPKVTSLQRRVMHAAYDRAVLVFRDTRHAGKKNISCRDVIRNCLAEFQARGLLRLTQSKPGHAAPGERASSEH